VGVTASNPNCALYLWEWFLLDEDNPQYGYYELIVMIANVSALLVLLVVVCVSVSASGTEVEQCLC